MNRPERTESQREASRLNGRASRGPVTAAGRERSQMNLCAMRHGLTGGEVLLPGESEAEFDEHQAGWRTALAPKSFPEEMIADIVVAAAWRLRRIEIMEAEHLRVGLEEKLRATAPAMVFRRLEEALAVLEVMRNSLVRPLWVANAQQLVHLSRGALALVARLEELNMPSPLVARLRLLAENVPTMEKADLELAGEELKDIAAASIAEVRRRLDALAADLQAERERLVRQELLWDVKTAPLLARYRRALTATIERQLQLLVTIRASVDSAGTTEDADSRSGSFGRGVTPAPDLKVVT